MRLVPTIASGLALVTIAALSGCSSTGYGTSYGNAPAPAPTGGSGTLTVLNFLGWCSVTVNGGAPSAGGTITATVAPGSVATIVATPASSQFQIGPEPWFGADQNGGGAAAGTDVGSGTTETSTITAAIGSDGAAKCVSVCCQEPGNSPDPCPTTNPCP